MTNCTGLGAGGVPCSINPYPGDSACWHHLPQATRDERGDLRADRVAGAPGNGYEAYTGPPDPDARPKQAMDIEERSRFRAFSEGTEPPHAHLRSGMLSSAYAPTQDGPEGSEHRGIRKRTITT